LIEALMIARILKTVISWLGWALLVVTIIVASFVLWGSRNGWEFAAILSGSMEPVLHVGGLVVIQPTSTDNLKVGDIISFKMQGVNTPICHRIQDIQVKGEERYFQTKGDANEEADQTLTSSKSIKGKAVLFVPYVGNLIEINKIGATKIAVPVFNSSIPVGAAVVIVFGLVFIYLVMKEVLDDVLWPGKKWQRDILKRQKERRANRRKAFGIG
jgi:signal peptidase I